MHPARKKKLSIILFALTGLGIAVALLLNALTSNINLFYSPADINKGNAPIGQTIRAGGLVVEGSVIRDPDTLATEFDVTDGEGTVTVRYTGILPDLFEEGQGVVALGLLQKDNLVEASQVLAKHDENYMPPEVMEALEKAHSDGQEKLKSARD